MKKLIALFCFILVLASCTKLKHADWNTLDKADYLIQYPKAWILDTSGRAETAFIIEPGDTANNKMHIQAVNLTVRAADDSKLDVQKFGEISVDEFKSKVPGITIIESVTIKSGNQSYYKLHFKADIAQFPIECTQYLWLKNKKSYILTFRSLQTLYPKYAATAIDILNSFQLK